MSQLSRKRRHALEELARREQAQQRINLEEHLFAEQYDFIFDEADRKIAVCSRRAGKTHTLVFYMLMEANKRAFVQIPYITLTRAQAKRNIWLTLQQLNKEYELGGKFNGNELTVTFPNGSVIFLCGANDETEIQRLRGGKYPLAVIDEAQHFRPFIRSLIRDILEPAVSDYRGTIVMTGTPGPACAGFYYEIATEQVPEAVQWSRHYWTSIDNPFHIATETWLEEVRRKNGWLPDNPTFLREYKGLWVHDDSRVVYKVGEINLCYNLPPADSLTYVLGIDLGYKDSTAFVVLGYDERVGRCYVIESRTEEKLIPSAVAARVDRYTQRFPFTKIVADSGGFGKGYVEEMRQRYSLNVEPAEKQRKYAFIELLNGDLQAGAIQIYKQRNQKLVDEMGNLLWMENEDGTADHTRIDERFDDHLCDALLYGWRACRQYFYDPELAGPSPGTPEYAQKVEDDMEAEQVRQWERENRALSGDYGDVFPDEVLDDGEDDFWQQSAAQRLDLLFP